MKIVYMGTPDFAVPPLAALVKNGYEVAAVVTQPDKPKGRGKTLLPTPVKEEAMKHEIPVYQPLKVRDPEFVETLKELPEKHNFDRQFNITASKIKAKIKKVYKVYRGVELRITDALENIDETIQSERDKDGNRYIKIKTNDEMVYNTFLMKKKEEE